MYDIYLFLKFAIESLVYWVFVLMLFVAPCVLAAIELINEFLKYKMYKMLLDIKNILLLAFVVVVFGSLSYVSLSVLLMQTVDTLLDR